jgi:hypothetical protein
MDSHRVIRQALQEQLGEHGWARVAVADRPAGYGSWEEWTLESSWEPRGLRACLSWWWGADRPQVTVSSQPAGHALYGRTEGHFCLGSRRRQELACVFDALARWRDWNVQQRLLAGAAGTEKEEQILTPAEELFGVGPTAHKTPLAELSWLECTDPRRLLEQARPRLSERKLRLLACACCRLHWPLMQDARNVAALEAMELYADGLVPKRDLKKARKAANLPWLTSYEPHQEALQALALAHRIMPAGGESTLCELVREVTGNPFRPETLKCSWLRWNNGTPVAMAGAIYAERRFEELPILADALEEAGCTTAAVLAHCRSGKEHVRGCWVLDSLLRKS